MTRTHQGMRSDRAEARRKLASLRGSTRIDVRHDTASDVLAIHDRYIRQGWDDETGSA